jgi:hypothetical protein
VDPFTFSLRTDPMIERSLRGTVNRRSRRADYNIMSASVASWSRQRRNASATPDGVLVAPFGVFPDPEPVLLQVLRGRRSGPETRPAALHVRAPGCRVRLGGLRIAHPEVAEIQKAAAARSGPTESRRSKLSQLGVVLVTESKRNVVPERSRGLLGAAKNARGQG